MQIHAEERREKPQGLNLSDGLSIEAKKEELKVTVTIRLWILSS